MDKRSIEEKKDDETGSSGVQRRSTRKRPNDDNNSPALETIMKKTKRESSLPELNEKMEPTNSSSIQNDDQKTKSIDDLPLEMIQAVLDKLPTLDLFKCRLMNRQWNKISSKMIRQRTDVELEFSFNKGKFVQSIRYRDCEQLLVDLCKPYSRDGTKQLTDLIGCITADFPYTNFRFGDLETFVNEDMQKFLSVWGANIRVLKIELKDAATSASILRELLFDKVTNLKKLELQFCKDENCYVYDEKTPSPIKIVDDDSEKRQLPNLEVLCVNIRFQKFRGIVSDILAAACNLKVFEILKKSASNSYFGAGCVHEDRFVSAGDSITSEDLAMLQLLNKSHCLKKLQLYVSKDLITYWASSNHTMDKLKLQSLAFALEPSIWESDQMKRSAASLVNQLLRSSKDSLETLSIEPLGSLPDLDIPKLENLKNLDLCGFPRKKTANGTLMFPTMFEMADNFPNLKELAAHFLRGDDYFPSSQPLKTMASVEVLRIYGGQSTEHKDKLMAATPNVTTLLLVEDEFPSTDNANISFDFQKIVTNVPKLQTLSLLICRFSYRHLLYKLDATITGLPEKFCKELSKKFRTKNHLSADEIASYQLRRENASILDLTALKQLEVSFFFDFDAYCDSVSSKRKMDEAGFTVEDKLYETGFTKVSEFLAFNLMPDLKVRQHKQME